MSDGYDFSPYFPKYHEAFDDWGVVPSTRVWMATGSFQPAASVEPGDFVFGQIFRKEDVMVEDKANDTEHIVKCWRPRLSARKVIGKRAVKARSWQLTFGDCDQQYESRRLVAGADTKVSLCPVDRESRSKRLVRCHTATENPRVETEYREAKQLDEEWSKQEGEKKFRPTQFTGQPRGSLVTVIPYESYGGQVGLFDTEERTYNRYAFAQTHEIAPLQEETILIQLALQPDTKEELGVGPNQKPRCNMIAQTPFAAEKETRKMVTDPKSDRIDQLQGEEDVEEFEQAWDEYAQKKGNAEVTEGEEITYEKTSQGVFHKSKNDEEIAKSLKKWYGIEDGFLNGGILLDMPTPDEIKVR